MVGILGSGLFLFISALAHLITPENTDKLLHKQSAIRLVGAVLIVLGLLSLTQAQLYAQIIGWLVCLSGFARLFFPKRMIRVNEWTSRYVHAVLMLFGAVACLAYYFASAT
jgi:hypothetical protein